MFSLVLAVIVCLYLLKVSATAGLSIETKCDTDPEATDARSAVVWFLD